MRKDWMTGDWVIISPQRAHRPLPHRRVQKRPETGDCPFCPGNERMTPPEVWADRESGEPNTPGWKVRSFPNLFPALSGGGCEGHKGNVLNRMMRGCGIHEVIVDCPEHDVQPATMSLEQLNRMLLAYRVRYREISGYERIRYIQIFRNHGPEAGRSITHPHSQLVATPIVPRAMEEELRIAKEYYQKEGRCLHDHALEREIDEGTRVVMDGRNFTVMCPFAPRSPYELYLFQKTLEPSFMDATDEVLHELASVLKEILTRLLNTLDDPPYNLYIHSAPCDDGDWSYFRWHIHIVPRLIGIGGFEMGTGICINSVPPERAATRLRES
jgi:UDPglucose--hexose-1-phosphate uridylyltransferase